MGSVLESRCVGRVYGADVCWCYGVVRLGWCGIRMQAEALVLQPASEPEQYNT